MRIISFSKKWDKLKLPEFTTFRFPRKDKDWYVSEKVQVFYKNRSPQREKLGEALIIGKRLQSIRQINESEAIADGFPNAFQMWLWLKETYKTIYMHQRMNKLTLRWLR